jgi:DNA modification methylase
MSRTKTRPAESAAEQSQARGLATRRVPLCSLHQDPANARAHGERNLEAIKASLMRFGQVEPLAVQKSSGRVIGGNARLAAMRDLGWTECDICELDLTALEATALGIALNRTAELAEWDEPVLARLLEGLRAEHGLEGVGYSDEEIDALLAGLDSTSPTPVEDPGPGEVPEKPVLHRGEVWLLGEHRLMCGDSTEPEDVQKLLAGERGTLLSTDPPYCVNYTGNDRPIHDGKPSGKDWSHVYHEVDIADLGKFLDGVLKACLPEVQEDAGIYIWHAHVQQPTVAAAFERHGLLLHQILVWVKPCATFGHSYYRWRHEPCAFGWKRGHKPVHGVGQLETVWEADWDGKARVVGNEHPCTKPTRLFEIPMEQHTRPGAVVLEPFSGSGSQLIAAEKLMRRCRAMEIEPAFVEVAIRRWEKATGKQARLQGTDQTYAEVLAQRS